MNDGQVSPVAHHRKSDGATQTLEQHLLGVAALARAFADKVGLADQGELIGLLHDLGKYSEQFQNYIRSAVGLINPDADEFVDAAGLKGKVDHSTAGAQLVWQKLSAEGEMGRLAGQILALCIASHHSGLIDCLSSDASSTGEDLFSKRMDKAEDRAHLHEVTRKMAPAIERRFDALAGRAGCIADIQRAIAQITRNARDPQQSNGSKFFKLGLLVRLLFSCLVDADRVDTANFESTRAKKVRPIGHYPGWDLLIERLERHLRQFKTETSVDQLRKRVSEQCHDRAASNPGVFTLTVPTGGGKTLASLRFALHHAKNHELDRVIYVVPYTTIIDQNAKVARGILEPRSEGVTPGSVVLEHHSNLTPEQQGWREKMLSENWDAPVVFTTSVQLLETLFGGGTRGARRMHQLANAVLIFDEIQTLPVNCVHLFCNGINFLVDHCGSSTVLCTATQPLLNRVDASKGALRFSSENEIIPDVPRLFDDLERVQVLNRRKAGGWALEEIASLAQGEVETVGSCLVIVNTKRAATELFEHCRKRAVIPVYHLSTRMCPAHRMEILQGIERLLKSDQRLLCVSTQLIEAGVDVDFGAVVRFTAGVDSIAQAAGRCNRHGRRSQRGRVHVVNPAEENLDRLTDIRIGRDNAERLLQEMENDPARFGTSVLAPQAIEAYFQYYFFDRRGEMDYAVSTEKIGHDDTLLNLLSVNSVAVGEYARKRGSEPSLLLRHSFMSAARAFKAIDAPTRGVVVPHTDAGKELINELCFAFEVDKQFDLLRRAQRYTVNLFPHELERLQHEGAVHQVQEGTDILYLHENYYSQDFGLSLTPSGQTGLLNA